MTTAEIVLDPPLAVLEHGKSISGYVVVRPGGEQNEFYGLTLTLATRKVGAGRVFGHFMDEKPLVLLEPRTYTPAGDMRVPFTFSPDALPPVPTFVGTHKSVQHLMIAAVTCRGGTWFGGRSVRTFTQDLIVQCLAASPAIEVEKPKRAWMTVGDCGGHCKLELSCAGEIDVAASLCGTLEARGTKPLRRISLLLFAEEEEEPSELVHRWTLWEAATMSAGTGSPDTELLKDVHVPLQAAACQPSLTASSGSASFKVRV